MEICNDNFADESDFLLKRAMDIIIRCQARIKTEAAPHIPAEEKCPIISTPSR